MALNKLCFLLSLHHKVVTIPWLCSLQLLMASQKMNDARIMAFSVCPSTEPIELLSCISSDWYWRHCFFSSEWGDQSCLEVH